MPDFPFAVVGFDLDGTLVDTAGDLTAAVNHALALADRPPLMADQLRPMVGLGAKHMLAQGLSATGGMVTDDAFRPLYRALLTYYADHIAVHSRPFAGAVTMLDQLDALGVRYGVVTNKFEGLARSLLDQLGLAGRIAAIYGADTLGTERAKPAPDGVAALVRDCGGGRAAFVGDSIYDVMAARGAGAVSIAVRFGFLHQPVEQLGADHIIAHFSELVPLLQSLD